MESRRPRIGPLALLLIAASCAAPAPPVPVRLADDRGLSLEQASLRQGPAGLELAARVSDRGLLSPVRRTATVTALAADGTRREVAHTRLELRPFDRAPARRARTGTIRAELPAGLEFERLEIELTPGR